MLVGDWRRKTEGKTASERYIVQSVTTVGNWGSVSLGPLEDCLEHTSFILSRVFIHPLPMSLRTVFMDTDHLALLAYPPRANCAPVVRREC